MDDWNMLLFWMVLLFLLNYVILFRTSVDTMFSVFFLHELMQSCSHKVHTWKAFFFMNRCNMFVQTSLFDLFLEKLWSQMSHERIFSFVNSFDISFHGLILSKFVVTHVTFEMLLSFTNHWNVWFHDTAVTWNHLFQWFVKCTVLRTTVVTHVTFEWLFFVMNSFEMWFLGLSLRKFVVTQVTFEILLSFMHHWNMWFHVTHLRTTVTTYVSIEWPFSFMNQCKMQFYSTLLQIEAVKHSIW
jgi:hypothetical protein